MARKPTKRRKFNLRRVRVSKAAAVGALAAADLIAVTLSGPYTNMTRIVSAKLMFSWIDKTLADGGMEFGLAHGDYSAAEIEECLEASTSPDIGDKIAQERANRMVRSLGTISGAQSVDLGEAAFNDGRPIHVKLNWLIPDDENLIVWMKNSSGTIYATGSSLSVLGDLWVKP